MSIENGGSMSDYENECMELARYPELSALAQCLWAYEHRKDKAAMKVAKEFFMRDPKHMARAVSMFPNRFTDDAGTGLYDMLAMIDIASLPLVPRAELAAQYADTTMSFSEVRERVDAYKGRKSKSEKEPKLCPNCHMPI